MLVYYEFPGTATTKGVSDGMKVEAYRDDRAFIEAYKNRGISDVMEMRTGRRWLEEMKIPTDTPPEKLTHQAWQNMRENVEPSSSQDMRQVLGQAVDKAVYRDQLLLAIAEKGLDAEIYVTRRTRNAEPQVWREQPPLEAIIAGESRSLSDHYTQRGVLRGEQEIKRFTQSRLYGRTDEGIALKAEHETRAQHKGLNVVASRLRDMFKVPAPAREAASAAEQLQR